MIKDTLSPGVGLLRPLLSHRRMSFAAFKAPMQTGWHAKDTKKRIQNKKVFRRNMVDWTSADPGSSPLPVCRRDEQLDSSGTGWPSR